MSKKFSIICNVYNTKVIPQGWNHLNILASRKLSVALFIMKRHFLRIGHSYEMFWQFFLQGNKFYNHSKVNRVFPVSLALIHCNAHIFYLKLIASMISFFLRAKFFNNSTNIFLRKNSWDYSNQKISLYYLKRSIADTCLF